MAKETVTVGCKMPHGLHLDLMKFNAPKERVTLKGNNSSLVIGGYGINEGVPKEFFDAWMKQNKHHPAVANGLIFVEANKGNAESHALELAELRHGLEPLNPGAGKDARVPGKVTTFTDKD